MAGGNGERLWPLSRKALPKQFLPLLKHPKDGKRISLLTATLQKLEKLVAPKDIYISTSSDYKAYLEKRLLKRCIRNVFYEPYVADTAACILLAAMKLKAADDEVLFFTPSDHYINDTQAYLQSLNAAISAAQESKNLVLIGIRCSRPSTKYGYLEFENSSALATCLQENKATKIKRFCEKPSEKKAKAFLKSGKFLWNSGTFFMQKKPLLQSFEKHAPEHFHTIQEYLAYEKAGKIEKAIKAFQKLQRKSFDYSIVEKLKPVLAIGGNFAWEDMGSTSSLVSLEQADENGNVLLAKTIAFSSKGVHYRLAKSKNNKNKEKILILNGVENIEVFVENDLIYIGAKNSPTNIKDLLKKLGSTNKNLL